MKPPSPMDPRALAAVVACLERRLTLRDNMQGDGRLITGLIAADMPTDVACSLSSVPIEVRVLSMAQRDGDGVRTSGNKVTWSWIPSADGRGAVRITTIEGMSAGVSYDVLLWIGGG